MSVTVSAIGVGILFTGVSPLGLVLLVDIVLLALEFVVAEVVMAVVLLRFLTSQWQSAALMQL